MADRTILAQQGPQFNDGKSNQGYVNPTFQSTFNLDGSFASPHKSSGNKNDKSPQVISSGKKFVSPVTIIISNTIGTSEKEL